MPRLATVRALELAAFATAAIGALIGTAGLVGVFEAWAFFGPALVAAVAAAGLSYLAFRRSFLLGESLLLSAAGFVIIGVLVTQRALTPSAFTDFVSALVEGWTDVLSTQPPVNLTDNVATVPFAIAWAGAFVSAELVRVLRVPGIAVLGGLLATAAAALMSVADQSVVLVQGVGLLFCMLTFADLQRRIAEINSIVDIAVTSGGKPAGRRGLAMGLVMVAVAGIAAPFAGDRLGLADEDERFELRDRLESAFDPLAEPSPLVTLKEALKEGNERQIDFRVESDPPITRWTLAVLDTYNGVVWEVADPQPQLPAKFVPVGDRLPPVQFAPVSGVEPVAHRITIVELTGPWVPHAGTPVEVQFPGGVEDLHMNIATGTLGLPRELRNGDVLDIVSIPSQTIADPAMSTATFAPYERGVSLRRSQQTITDRAQNILEGIPIGGSQIVELSRVLREGFYDSSVEMPPGHSWGRLATFLRSPDDLVGFEEQFAAGAGVLARTARIPTRIVVGYQIPADRYENGVAEVLAGDRSAWIEVLIADVGWVAVDVTPDEQRKPQEAEEGSDVRTVAIPNDPPPPPEAEEEILDVENDFDDEDPEAKPNEEPPPEDETDAADEEFWSWVHTTVGAAAVAIGSVLALAATLLGAIVLAKQRRTNRRRTAESPAARVTGAWAELVDRLEETGYRVPDNVTPQESAVALASHPDFAPVASELINLAEEVDRTTFAPITPTDDAADRAWVESDVVSQQAMAGLAVLERTRIRVDPRPLRRRINHR